MDFSWSEKQLEFYDAVVEFARTQLNDDVVLRDKNSVFPMELWQKCADFGIQSLPLPEHYSQRKEVDFLTAILAMEALGYACSDNGLNFALNAQMWTVQLPLLRFGSDELKEQYLPGMCKGQIIGAHAITEPATGSDVFNMEASATRSDGGYIINGHKHYISLGPIADIALVFARTDPDAGKWGVSAFVVDTASDGVEVGANREKMGLRTVPFGDLTFT
ncbi:MAG: acyl-CoA dehydrogenase, partial [Gammaproteobacteria bacterium]|nr:acyl-CoA dehydrogenase [Gammaproteobacteria bacterium]